MFRNYTKIIEQWACSDPGILEYYGGKSLLTQSHGQSIMSFFRACFHMKGVYLLDEPEAGLSAKTQMALRKLIDETAGATAQFIIATHSPLLMSYSGGLVYNFDSAPVVSLTIENCPILHCTKIYSVVSATAGRKAAEHTRAYRPPVMIGTV